MKEPYEKGPANRLGPASCAGDGNIAGVAGTGVHAGQVLTSEITTPACRPCPDMGKATRQLTLFGESAGDAAESETLCMCGTFQHGNRETPETSSPASAASGPGDGERWEKVSDQASHVYVSGESDDLVVPEKQANKASPTVAAESVEGRGSTKGNALQQATVRTQRRNFVSFGLCGVREAARRDKRMRFTALLHHLTPELLLSSFLDLKRQAAPGIDGLMWQDYAEHLETRIPDLHDQIHRGTYRAQPSKRTWIPKADGRQRPLGLAAVEDKIVQQATKTVLECVYEADFLGFSYGYRPGRGGHNTLDALWVGLTSKKVNWVLDADIRGFFDAIDHEWLLKFVQHRIADRRILRLLRKWLRAGVSENGQWSETKVGTPQGSVISPLLANVFLHYVFDLWIEDWRKRHAAGDVIVVRYADDFVIGFQHRSDAERCLGELRERFCKFGLELHPEKTRLIEFGRFAAERRAHRGQGKPETFNFLGFTHISGKTRKGAFTIQRKSIAKKMRAKLQELKAILDRRLHEKVSVTGRWLRSVVQGWFNYHAVPGNFPCLDQFLTEVQQLWRRALRRRSQRGRRWNWKRLQSLFRRWLPKPKILHPYPNQRFAVTHPR
jgi:RNA-directed DNA polymerase